MANFTGYELSKDWFDWCFENPEKITPTHTALYFFIIEHWNRLGQKPKFGLPMEVAKDAIGIKNYRTYSNSFNDLVEWGFIDVLQKSKNQYSANVIAILKNTKANTKALSKAIQKHSQKQVHGIVCIDNYINNETIEPINNEIQQHIFQSPIDKLKDIVINDQLQMEALCMAHKIHIPKATQLVDEFCIYLKSTGEMKKDEKDFKRHLTNWIGTTLKKQHSSKPSINNDFNPANKLL